MSDEISKITRAVPFDLNGDDSYAGFSGTMLRWVAQGVNMVPPWWSPQRDLWLRRFVADNGPLKVAVTTFINKLVTIPWTVQAKDRSNLRHVARAAEIEDEFRRNSGSMSTAPLRGFKEFLKLFANDYLVSDNGAFALVMGEAPADRPIVGKPLGLLHLDSTRCVRTRDPEYPVRYLDKDGAWHKLHYTRVLSMSNLPSTDQEMCGVGLCAVSCCIEAAQELWDIYRYNAERMGSRPPRQILYIKTGGTIKNLEDAIKHWQIKVDNEGRTHFGGTLLLAPSRANQDLSLDLIDLNRVPENFSRRDTTTIDMIMIAAAFGLDLRDLSFSMSQTGQTKSDAEVQDRKGRGKGVGEFIETFVERFEQACLNTENFYFDFDNIDDEQDEQQARVRDLRSQGRERDLRSGVTTVRAEREMMWQRGEISQELFEDMELLDGRLPNGLDVMLLFQSGDADINRWLDLETPDPTDIEAHDALQMSKRIHERIIDLSQEINETSNSRRNRKARQALAALEKLRSMYRMPDGMALEHPAMPEDVDPHAEAVPKTTTSTPNDENDDLTAQSSVVDSDEEKSLKLKQEPEEIDEIVDLYFKRRMEDLLRQARERTLPQRDFEDAMANLIAFVVALLFLRGARASSVVDLPDFAAAALRREIASQISFVRNLAADLYAPTGYPTGVMSPENRLNLWANAMSAAYYTGALNNPADPFLTWRLGIAEHCTTCLALEGVTRRASVWRTTPYRPRNTEPGVLECGGFNCKCWWQVSDGPDAGVLPSAL